MRMHVLGLVAVQLGVCLGIAGCGASTPQSNTAETAPSSSASAASASAAAKPSAAGQTADNKAPAEEPAKSGPSPQEVLSRDGVLYSIAFEDSDIGKKAVDACAKESGGEPKKRAACMAKAREKLEFDGVQFTRDKEGVRWYVIIRKKGTTLHTLHKIKFQFAEETATTVAIVPEGKDIGSAAAKLSSSKVVFEVPSDFRISNVDPKYGKLFYEAKMIGTGSN